MYLLVLLKVFFLIKIVIVLNHFNLDFLFSLLYQKGTEDLQQNLLQIGPKVSS